YWGLYDQPARVVPEPTGDEPLLTGRVQKAEHRGAGVEQSVLGFRLGLDAYEKRFHRLDGVVSRFVEDVEERHLITHGASRGVEASLQRTGGWSNWWLAYTLGRSRWTGDGRTFTRDFDQLHSVTVSNTLQLTPGWDLGLSYAFHTGTPYTEQSWQREGVSDWSLTEGSPNGARLPDYHRLDVRVRRHFRWDRCQLSVYAEALNVTNHPNVLWYGWRLYDDNGPLSEAQRVTRTGIPGIPSLGLEVRF
ncbi:MAG TPA: TonB-dependent receptor, partial [bacterium]|nr:TonB-dependent receptor [bacterium]